MDDCGHGARCRIQLDRQRSGNHKLDANLWRHVAAISGNNPLASGTSQMVGESPLVSLASAGALSISAWAMVLTSAMSFGFLSLSSVRL